MGKDTCFYPAQFLFKNVCPHIALCLHRGMIYVVQSVKAGLGVYNFPLGKANNMKLREIGEGGKFGGI